MWSIRRSCRIKTQKEACPPNRDKALETLKTVPLAANHVTSQERHRYPQLQRLDAERSPLTPSSDTDGTLPPLQFLPVKTFRFQQAQTMWGFSILSCLLFLPRQGREQHSRLGAPPPSFPGGTNPAGRRVFGEPLALFAIFQTPQSKGSFLLMLGRESNPKSPISQGMRFIDTLDHREAQTFREFSCAAGEQKPDSRHYYS